MKYALLALLTEQAMAAWGSGDCPSVSVANVNSDNLAGRWYEQSRDSDFFWDRGHECTTNEFNNGSLYFGGKFFMWYLGDNQWGKGLPMHMGVNGK